MGVPKKDPSKDWIRANVATLESRPRYGVGWRSVSVSSAFGAFAGGAASAVAVALSVTPMSALSLTERRLKANPGTSGERVLGCGAYRGGELNIGDVGDDAKGDAYQMSIETNFRMLQEVPHRNRTIIASMSDNSGNSGLKIIF